MATSPHPIMTMRHRIILPVAMVSFIATCALAGQTIRVVESFEQNYIRQLPGDYLVPIIAPSRLGINLCAVGTTGSTRQIVERYLMLLNELSPRESSVHFVLHSSACPTGTTALIQFSNEEPTKDFANLLDRSNSIFGLDMSLPSYPRWTPWEGTKTAFQIGDNNSLFSISVVRTSAPADVVKAFTIKAMFMLSTTSQNVEWAGPFFSIAQAYEPTTPNSMEYTAVDFNYSIEDYTVTNARGLCWSDVINISFLSHEMSDGATPSQAQQELSEKNTEIAARMNNLNIFGRYRDILDGRCVRQLP